MRHLPPRALLVSGPVVLAFFSGGFGEQALLVALAVAALTLAWTAAAAPARDLYPASPAARLAVGSLVLFAGWVALSTTWAPLPARARVDAERAALYAIVLIAGTCLWRARDAARLVEPAVAAGTLVVTVYGLAGRLAPGIVTQHPSASAGGRLDQPLTYWNAEGALAALGFVLCARLAGDRDRPTALRAAAAAGAVPLAAGVAMSFSRGAIVALAAGLIVLLVLAPTWTQLRAIAVCLEAGVAGTIACEISPAVRTLDGSAGVRQWQGAVVLVVLLAAMAAGAALLMWAARAEAAGTTRLGRLPLPSWAGVAATATVCALVLVPVAVGRGGDGPQFGATSQRLQTASSNRYEYWKVALQTFADHPVAGVGTGGYAVEWLKRRTIQDRVRDAHSLPLETLAELGLVGALLLAASLGGVALCARRVQARDPALAAGPAAALTVWAVHSAVDWDWEMPALTLPAITLASVLLARASARPARAAPCAPGAGAPGPAMAAPARTS
ncbi:MAG: hypothetical protein JWO02_3555 [Solirubrobacterales bacterium]|nr:hypothetical protein [Solirubrobacterales bacterium]